MGSEQFLRSVLWKKGIGFSAGALCVAMMLGSGFSGQIPVGPEAATPGAAAPGTDWPNYGGNKAGNRYSPLDQINIANVKDLQVAWMYDASEKPDPANPGRQREVSTSPAIPWRRERGGSVALQQASSRT